MSLRDKLMAIRETEFRAWLRAQMEPELWCTVIEYGLGGDEGNPDMAFGKANGMKGEVFWAELKVGRIENGVLIPREFRPAQMNWHGRARRAGQRTAFVVGAPAVGYPRSGWMVFAVKPGREEGIAKLGDGWTIGGEDLFHLSEFDTRLGQTMLGWFRSFT